MVNIRRLPGPKNPAEMTYYVQLDGVPISGTSAAKTLNTVDSQTMALTLGYFVQLQAERTQLPLHTHTHTHTHKSPFYCFSLICQPGSCCDQRPQRWRGAVVSSLPPSLPPSLLPSFPPSLLPSLPPKQQ